MAPASLLDLVSALPSTEGWGPPVSTETTLDGVPYAPYSKADKLGRMADWTEGKDRDARRQQYGSRAYRDQQVYGANQQSNPFAIQAAEEEATFSLVDNTRASNKTRTFGRGGTQVFRGRTQRGGVQQQRGGRATYQRVGQGRTAGLQDRSRNPRGGRRGGYRDDKPQRNRDASIQVKPDWNLLEEIDFARLTKLSLDTPDGDDIDSYGFLYQYDRSYDKQPGAKTSEKRLNVLERAAYNVSTSSDPIIQELAEKEEGTIFATDSILSMLMCAPRSVYPWDLVITKTGEKVFIDKREGSTVDMVTVNENAADAPLETSEGNKDSINSPSQLMLEATHINQVFPTQVVIENDSSRRDMPNEHPFYNAAEETDPPASKAYKYRRFDLSLASDEEPLNLIVRTELDAITKNTVNGEDQFLTIKALNEFDSKAQGSGGALDWRSKLASQRGAVVATEMKNNSLKLARWTIQSILAKADMMKLGFVSRVNPRSAQDHVILGVLGYKPREFAAQMNLNIANGWGIVRTIVDMVLKMGDGKYVIVKDPNKNVLRLYAVPNDAFDEEGSVAEKDTTVADDDE
ncbi:eukaryotic translation initiation factor 3 subunit D [Verruconis gallopava]|uniref:Eukaryotic translation initiation factor 3 subunit D n=1 Tax=Verruconis gallopava TaxID=253628 RepID=A0A0D1XN34_9PEZI|nr:eukaryotic translation initiation factor 3 subunit D [Verruconis gallopava]KIW03991.1 eukaryotic translation initiation factor 3 subunit D [Verruconis gallopava]